LDDSAADLCAQMSLAPLDEVNELVDKGPSRAGYPVWGANGKYYEAQFRAENDGVTAIQPGEIMPSRYTSNGNCSFRCGAENFTVLTDANYKIAHVFKATQYVESFPIAEISSQGWWLQKNPAGELWAKRQFVVDVDPSSTDPARENKWIWVGLNLGKGEFTNVYDLDRGLLVSIARAEGKEVVFLDYFQAEKIAQAQK
jgi:hypothetical protein